MTWLFKFFKSGKTISQAIKEFFEMNGRMPNARETLKMKDIFRQSQSNVIPFKYKKTFKKEIEGMDFGEVIPSETPLTKDDFFRIKQGLSTKIKLNTLGENKQFAKELIHNKNAEFNSLDRAAQKEILERLDINMKNAQAEFATPIKPDDLASGGRIGYEGGLKVWGKSVKEQWANLNEDQKNYIKEHFPDQVPEEKASGGRASFAVVLLQIFPIP